MKTNFLTFYTEGHPIDNGWDLKDRRHGIKAILQDSFDKTIFYTPSKVSRKISEQYVKEVPNSGHWGKIGNQAWKPAIIHEEIKKMSTGDILIYHDINYKKYRQYTEIKNLKNLFPQWLEWCDFDFFIPMSVSTIIFNTGEQGEELHVQPLKQWCKQHSLRNLAIDYDFSCNFLQCVVNLMVFRKTDVSLDFIKLWLNLCEQEQYMNSMDYESERDGSFLNHLPEQSAANIILCNWIVENKHNIPEDYPRFGFIDRDITKPVFKTEI